MSVVIALLGAVIGLGAGCLIGAAVVFSQKSLAVAAAGRPGPGDRGDRRRRIALAGQEAAKLPILAEIGAD